jgi:glycosyltransferase involved in cell wall biosynthesis
MDIGIDVHHLRYGQAGISNYIRHLLDELFQFHGPHKLRPFLYGYPGIQEPDTVRLLTQGPRAALQYCWDGPVPWLISHYLNGQDSRLAQLAGGIDDRVLWPLWRAMSTLHSAAHQGCPAMNRLCRHALPVTVDLYHHMGLLILPMHHFRMNVMTIFDLATVLTPEHHVTGGQHLDWFNEAFAMASKMEALIAISECTKRDIVNTLGIPPHNIFVTPLAAHAQFRPAEDPEELERVLAKYDLIGQPYVVHVGTLEPRKNVTRLIEAFHRFLQQQAANKYHLILVGKKGWMWEGIFETIHDLGLGAKVRWLGCVPFEDLPALYQGADLCLYPSLYEGFGLPPLEAMSCGTPVISSNVSSIPEVVGDAGVLVDPTQVEEIASAMRWLLSNHEQCAAYRARGLARSQQFTWERTARLTLEVYDHVRAQAQRQWPRKNQPPGPVSKCQRAMRAWVISQLPRRSRYGQPRSGIFDASGDRCPLTFARNKEQLFNG